MTEIIFADVPLLMELERWTYTERGIMWRPAWEARVDEVSIKVFGVTKADLERPDPDYLSYPDRDAYNAACDEVMNFRNQFLIPADKPEFYDGIDFLGDLGIDIWDEDYHEFRVAEFFTEQAIAAAKGLAGARFTPDGSGTRAGQGVETWSAALQAQAAAFMSRAR